VMTTTGAPCKRWTDPSVNMSGATVCFQTWFNENENGSLRTDGVLDEDTLSALVGIMAKDPDFRTPFPDPSGLRLAAGSAMLGDGPDDGKAAADKLFNEASPGATVAPVPVSNVPPSSTTSDLFDVAMSVVQTLNKDPKRCENVRRPGTTVNRVVHNFKLAWNSDPSHYKLPVGTGNYEQSVSDALSSVLGYITAPSGCADIAPVNVVPNIPRSIEPIATNSPDQTIVSPPSPAVPLPSPVVHTSRATIDPQFIPQFPSFGPPPTTRYVVEEVRAWRPRSPYGFMYGMVGDAASDAEAKFQALVAASDGSGERRLERHPDVAPVSATIPAPPPVIAGSSSISPELASAVSAAVDALSSDQNYCVSVRQPGSPVNRAVHAFKVAWNKVAPKDSKVPVGTGNYEASTAAALSALSIQLGLGFAMNGCDAAPAAPFVPPPPPPVAQSYVPPPPREQRQAPRTVPDKVVPPSEKPSIVPAGIDSGAIVAGILGAITLGGVLAIASQAKPAKKHEEPVAHESKKRKRRR